MASFFEKINLFLMRFFDFVSFRKKTDKYYDNYDEDIFCLNDDTNTFSE